MKNFLFLLLLSLSTLTMHAYNIYTINYNDITYELYLNSDTNSATACIYNGNSCSGDIVIPEKIPYSDTEYTVTSIRKWAFSNCDSLISIYLPSTVESIGEYAFNECGQLKSINLPPSLTNIGSYAFKDCKSLDSVTIPSAVSVMALSVFWGCTGITNFVIEDSDTELRTSSPGTSVYSGFGNISPQTLYVGRNTYYPICPNDSNLVSLTFGDKVTTINQWGFRYCTSLKSVTIPSTVTTIRDGAFMYCSGLESVTLTNPLVTIQNSAFRDCTSLRSISIPNKTIEFDAFRNCTSLDSLIINNTVTFIDTQAFNGCTGLKTIIFEDGDEELSFGTEVFTQTEPTYVYFGRDMNYKIVPSTSMETVEFGENIWAITAGTFKKGTTIRTVKSHNTFPPSTDNTFSDDTYSQGILYVPSGSISAYASAAGWKNFTTIKSLDGSDAIENVYTDHDTAFGVSDGILHIAGNTPIQVITTNGAIVYSGQGKQDIKLNAGMYIVVSPDKASKIVVR